MLPASPDAAPSAGPVGAQQRPPGRMEKPALQRPWPFLRALAEMGWSCLLPGFPKPAKDRPRGISHLCGCSGTRPSVSPPSRPPRGAWRGLCASVCPSNSSPLHSDPSQPKPIASLPRLRSLQQPQTQPTCPRQRAGRRHLLLPPARAPDGPRSSVGTPPPGRWVGGISWPGVTPSPATPSRVSSTG